MSELKPCPKCETNGAPLRRIGEMDEYRVECIKCYTVRTPWFKTPGEAEAYWNAFAEGMNQQGARIAELEAERDRLLEAMCRIERKINSAKTACPPFVQREFVEAQEWAHEALEGGK